MSAFPENKFVTVDIPQSDTCSMFSTTGHLSCYLTAEFLKIITNASCKPHVKLGKLFTNRWIQIVFFKLNSLKKFGD